VHLPSFDPEGTAFERRGKEDATGRGHWFRKTDSHLFFLIFFLEKKKTITKNVENF
jgi:hypothetical protein